MSPSMLIRRNLLACCIGVCFSALALVPAPACAADFTSGRIKVTAEGDGRDVILIAGLNSSPRVWREMVRAVPGYRYHLVQVAGFAGHARGGNAQGAIAAPVADEIARYIVAGRLDKPTVIGHSMGGTIGLMLAARHAELPSKLMVIDMLPFLGAMFGPPGTTSASVKPMADLLLVQMRAANAVARRARVAAAIDSMVDTVAMRPGALDDALNSDADVAARAYHELLVTDLRPELDSISVPTTVLYVVPKAVALSAGKMDAWYASAYAPLKGATLKRIAGSAHFIMWDQAQKFQAEVKVFLAPAAP